MTQEGDIVTEAMGLPERARFTLEHCDRAMRFRGSHTSWQGKPGQGYELTTCRYTCDGCAATLELHLTEPDSEAVS
jgi:hypothetical protein